MARFFGEVGYGDTIETPSGSGIWVDEITEKSYFGDIIRKDRSLIEGDKVNADINIGNSISIIADQDAIDNFSKIKYVKWSGGVWTVTSVEVRSPRLLLTLGGVYNGPTA